MHGGDSIIATLRMFQHSSIQTPRHNFNVRVCTCIANELYAKTKGWEVARD